jgi:hypothetical protein
VEKAEQLLLDAVEKYQEEMSLAEVSGQLNEFVEETFSISMQTIAHTVDSIGESISGETMAQVACEDFDVHGDDVGPFIAEHFGVEASRLVTAIGQQVGAHSFCIGFLFAQKLAKEKVNG